MSGPVVVPIPFPTVRHQCPFCRKTRAHRGDAVAHIARCWQNPATRGCLTCVNYDHGDCGAYPEDPGWPPSCDAGVRLDNGKPITGCPEWEARDA